ERRSGLRPAVDARKNERNGETPLRLVGQTGMDTVTVNLRESETLLDRLLDDGVAIAHDCGGTLACSSCAVVITQGADRLRAASEDELDMLDRGGADAPGARLACQVSGTAELVLEIPRQEAPAHEKTLPVTVT